MRAAESVAGSSSQWPRWRRASALNAVIRKALEKDLYSRYRNGAEFAKDLAAVRYRIVDDGLVPPDTSRFPVLRKLSFFTEFDDVEVWEVLRICNWRKVDEGVTLIREGSQDQRFGIVLDGRLELSIDGRRVIELGPGDVFGEHAWLDQQEHRHTLSAVTLSPLTCLEINPSALALASEEVRERFRQQISSVLVRRMTELSRAVAQHNGPARHGEYRAGGGLDLQLVDG